ncbi:helix-turn-helix domain-containing protein [Streptomyces sp. CoH17]|uniref:helix-turn-helix domain-containing protein n=1 Tax=Streptomyces sp. CoH17 TaxID=2992806 RepID=UPI002271BB2E|nr:helix-turn-helix domain-containing protein [Streptomyces sp. CoH17]
MLANVFDSRELAVQERAEAWRELTGQFLAPNEFDIEEPEAFGASLSAADLGDVQVAAMTYTALRSRRTPRLIRRSDPGQWVVGLILGGRQGIDQKGRQQWAEARELVLYTESHPYETRVEPTDGRGTAASVVARFDPADVPLPTRHLDRLLATPLSGSEGVGGLLGALLAQLATDTGPHRATATARLGGVFTDLLTGCLAHHLDLRDRTPTEHRRRLLLLQVRDFIRRRLGDADLSPSVIAAANHISPRTLHRLFEDSGTTVASYVRGQRLRRVREDLGDPGLASRPVHAIAGRWGFSRPSDFGRAFRRAYGVSPAAYREDRLRRVRGARPAPCGSWPVGEDQPQVR